MGREGWIYAIAFLVILGVGAMIILPRLDRDRPVQGWNPDPLPDLVEPPREAGPEVRDFRGRPAYAWMPIVLQGPEGRALRGPLRTVHGARVRGADAPAGDARTHLVIQPEAAAVSFGAAGHQWVTLPAGAIHEGRVVTLPTAAPSVIVRVREPDGQPAPDVPVLVRPAPPGEVLRTDAGGTLVLDFLGAGMATVDCMTHERAGPHMAIQPGRDRDVRLSLEPVWEVRGRIFDRDATPLANARVEAFAPRGSWGRVVRTQADGSFVWRGPAIARVALRCTAPGRAEQAVEVTPPAVGPLRSDIGTLSMESAALVLVGQVDARIQEPDAHVRIEPAVGALVREVFGAGRVLGQARRIPLREDGAFRIDNLPGHLPLRVSVRGAGVPHDEIVQGAPGEELRLEIAPLAGQAIVGTIEHPDGRPAAGVTLLASPEPRDGDLPQPGDIPIVSGADGSFEKRGFPGRVVYLRAYVPGHRSLLKRVMLPLEAPLSLTLQAALRDPTRLVEGRVYDGVATRVEAREDNASVGEHARVHFGAPLAGVTVRAAGVEARTDREGRFRLEGVESLAPTVVVAFGYEPGRADTAGQDPTAFARPAVVRTTPGGAPLDLVLPRAASLRFRARDAVDDTPISFLHVVVRTKDGRLPVDRGIATRDGHVHLQGLPPGGLELTVVSHARRYTLGPVQLVGGQERDLGEILLTHGMRIEGRVVDTGGRGIGGARVGAFGKGWQHAGQDPGAERELLFRTVQADPDGRFVLEGFDPRKPADLAIWAPGYAPTAERVQLPRFSDVIRAEVEIELDTGGYLALDVRERAGRAGGGDRVHGAVLDLEFAQDGSDFLDVIQRGVMGGTLGSTFEWRHVSDQLLVERRGDDGYILGPLRPGPYVLWMEHPGYAPVRHKLTVIDPEQTILHNVVGGEALHYEGRVTRLFLELTRVP